MRLLTWRYTISSKPLYVLFLVSLLAFLALSPALVSAVNPPPSNLNVGPYVDKLVFKAIADPNNRILAIQAGEIEMDTEFSDPMYLGGFEDPDIDIYAAIRNGYGHITINCEKYPLNISGFRRAFAFAFDKTAVTVDIMDGFSQEHDSLVPYVNGWCVEDEFDWHYYTDQTSVGNQILDSLGFEINVTSGFRLTPNGESFDIAIEYSADSPEIAGGTAQIGVDALHRLHIDAHTRAADFNEFLSRLDSHGDYDMAFYAQNFYSNDVDWLAYEYWSDYADVEYQNPTNFRNATYDSWRDQLLYGTSYEEVYEAASEMQKILHYNVPRIVVYMNTNMQMYRNDRFTGHVEDLGRYITGPWTARKIHKLDGSFGGTVPIAVSHFCDSFNFFTAGSNISASVYSSIFDNLMPSLFKYGPDMNPWPDLATNMFTETHSDNAAVPDGHTRFTIDIVQNATWSDGMPLTAEDVAFTFLYQFESGMLGGSIDPPELVLFDSPSPYRVILEYNTESYWHFSDFAFDYIIPEHIFNDATGIGYDGWDNWNPIYDPSEPFVTCGPYAFSDFEAGEFLELSHNPDFYHRDNSRYIDENLSISSTEQMIIYRGTTGNEIVWHIYGTQGTYSIFKNATLRETGSWTDGYLTHNIDDLEIGTYSFLLTVNTSSGHTAFDTILVYVREPNISQPPPPVNLLAITISAVSSVIIVGVLISIYWNKKFQEGS